MSRDYLVKTVENGLTIIASGEEVGENQINADDSRISNLIANGQLAVGDTILIQEKVLSDANLTLEEKAYLVQMTTNGEAVINAIIANSLLENGILKAALDLKVDKVVGYSLVSDTDIAKLQGINTITTDKIDEAINEIFK